MRHPALTRFFAAFLAVVSVITLISGGVCIKKAADSMEKQNTNTARLSEKAAEAKELRAALDAMPESFERKSDAYDEAKERYDSEKLSYRKDLSIYTATEAALKQAQEKIDEGYAALRMGWIEHDNGEKALNDAEAQFRPGYEQYLAGKAQLEEGKKQVAQAEKLLESIPDPGMLRTGLDALKASRTEIGASLDAIQNTLEHPPTDPETGEVDSAAQSAQLLSQLAALSGRLAAVQASVSDVYGAEAVSQALAALARQAGSMSGGGMSEEELVAAARNLVASGQSLSGAFNSLIASSEQTLTMLEGLPELKAQLAQAEAALKEGEPALLKAKKAFEEGRAGLEKAKQALIYAEAQLIKGKKELEEKQAEQLATKEDLDRRKTELEQEAERLAAMLREVEDYRDKKDRFGNLRYALLADEGISARVRAGEDLIEGSEEELRLRAAGTKREYELRLAAAIAMIAAALCGVVTTCASFRDRQGVRILLPAALAFVFAALAECLSVHAARGPIYTVLFVGLFAAAVLALNLKKA
ncbi:MAG: hypothetical protein IJQ43_05710 [Oscillospiraceae bacterium]|nr:hypothetical protein [Oscillospiraceae bacterium]